MHPVLLLRFVRHELLGDLSLDRGEVLLPRGHRLLERDDLRHAVDHLLDQLNLGEPDALLVGDVELVLDGGGVLPGRSPWLQIELVAHLILQTT